MSQTSPGVPVFYSLAQVRFNPISAMADYVPKVQDVLRREGWPDYQPQTGRQVQVDASAGDEPQIKQQERIRWSFNAPSKMQGFVLDEGSLVFHATCYEGFSSFLKNVLRGLEVVHEIVELQHVTRVGLRYLNAVDPEAMGSLPMEELVQPGILGLSGSHSEGLRHSFSETVSEERGGTMISRALVSPNGVSWPPDLQPSPLEPEARFRVTDHKVVILDNDFFKAFEPPLSYDMDQLRDELVTCHEMSGQMLQETTTGKARSIWGIYE